MSAVARPVSPPLDRPGRVLDPTASLQAILARADRLLAAAVDLAASIAPPPDAPPMESLRGLYVSDAEAAHLVSRGSEPMARRLAAERPIVRLNEAGPSWHRLALAFELSADELDTVALALLTEIDLRYERIFGYLHDDMTRRRLTPDLVGQLLCMSFNDRMVSRALFASDAPLIRNAILRFVVEPGQPRGPTIGSGLSCDEGIVEFLLETGVVDRRIAPAVRWLGHDEGDEHQSSPAADAAVALLARELDAHDSPDGHFQLVGPDGRLATSVARRVASEIGRPLLLADLPRLERLEETFAEGVRLVARMSVLHDALVLWTGGERVTGSDAESASRLAALSDALDAFPGSGHLMVSPTGGARGRVDGFTTIQLPLPGSIERRRVWARRLREHRILAAEADVALLAEVFRIDAGAIEQVVQQAATDARQRGSGAVTHDNLIDAARAQVLRSLPRYASRVPAGPRWDDIVLPADPLRQLSELCDRVRHRATVLDEWGFSARLTLGRGIAALFAGPSGTGKTMAAQIIAATLGMDLFRIEIPAVVSKYIGETEKALDQVFREAQGTNVILFFDEADALFGKRSEVKDAHDRYANIEISYLLQAIEQYDGLTILATNLRHNVDDAFVRRLAFAVTFPMPDVRERRSIWQKSWPAQVPLGDDLDLDFLARQFVLAGGNIRNVALSAAFAAAADGGPVTMTHVVRGVRREFQKMGKACVESDFGPYFSQLAG